MFAAAPAAPAAGEAICLFLEGTSHARGRLERLRTGAARMVPNSCAAGHAVTIVPVGSTSTPWSGSGPEAGAVRALTDCIEQRLKHLLVEAEPRHDLASSNASTASTRPLAAPRATRGNRSGRRRLIAAGMAKLREQDPARLAEIMAHVEEYLASLSRFGLRERDLERRIPAADVVRFRLREGLLVLLLGPVALASVVVFAVPYRLTNRVGRRAPNLQSRAV